jgi:WD40 repeat protein
LWDAAGGNMITAQKVNNDINNVVWMVAFNADGTLLASVGHDKRVSLWKIRTANP